MSYEKHIKIPKEEFDKFRCTSKPDSFLKQRLELIADVLNGTATVSSIMFSLQYVSIVAKQEIKYIATKRYDEGDLWVCGREYSRPDDNDLASTIESATEDLFLMAKCVKKPDWFDDNERWCELLTEIKGKIDWVVDESYDAMWHEIFDPYSDEESDESSDEPQGLLAGLKGPIEEGDWNIPGVGVGDSTLKL